MSDLPCRLEGWRGCQGWAASGGVTPLAAVEGTQVASGSTSQTHTGMGDLAKLPPSNLDSHWAQTPFCSQIPNPTPRPPTAADLGLSLPVYTLKCWAVHGQ